MLLQAVDQTDDAAVMVAESAEENVVCDLFFFRHSRHHINARWSHW